MLYNFCVLIKNRKCFFCGCLAFVIAILAIFLMRESDAYIESKLRILKMSDEEKLREKIRKLDTGNKK